MKTIEELEAELEKLTEKVKEIDAKLLFIASYIVGEELEVDLAAYETVKEQLTEADIMTVEEMVDRCFAASDDRPDKLDS